MLELFILRWLMEQEGRDSLVQGTLLGYSLSYLQKKFVIPKGTFYRAVNRLIAEGMIVKQSRNFYVCSDGFRKQSNSMKNSNCVNSKRVMR